MKTILVICDNRMQYKDYMLPQIARELHPSYCTQDNIGMFRINDTFYISICSKDDIRKVLGIERNSIEIRIIGKKATTAYMALKAYAEAFGVNK